MARHTMAIAEAIAGDERGEGRNPRDSD
jgi:hypothetical protein